MQGEVLIKVEGVSKKFCLNLKRSLWYGVSDIARGMVGGSETNTLRKDEFWAVRDVSFEVRRGECLGLIGHNGAGKSTLLKMLNGLIRPDEGRIEMHGKIGALIELGAGFNPVLTGRENVYNNGAVLGFSKADIDRKFDEIVAFAELEEFIDMPVQNYSSGMKVRLGFAVASQMEPDILIIDEVLAVGDVGFRIKCINIVSELMQKAAVIFVSHSMPQIFKVSSRLILLNKGRIDFDGIEIGEGVELYYNLFENEKLTKVENNFKIESFKVNEQTARMGEVINIVYLSDLNIFFSIKKYLVIKTLRVVIRFTDKSLNNIATAQLDVKYNEQIFLRIPRTQFGAGQYNANAYFIEIDTFGRENILAYYTSIFIINSVGSLIANHAPIQFQLEEPK